MSKGRRSQRFDAPNQLPRESPKPDQAVYEQRGLLMMTLVGVRNGGWYLEDVDTRFKVVGEKQSNIISQLVENGTGRQS